MTFLVFLIPILAVVLAVVALAVRLDSRGPILFRQKRYGLGGRVFTVTKFRTMKVEDTDQSGARQAKVGDSRVTRIGRVLRKTCLDELPQLWDVLRGEMSLVGPRPHPVGMEVNGTLMEKLYPGYHRRHLVRPGLTGLAQINGNRGPIHEYGFGKERLDYDSAYIENWSAWMDLKILVRTVVLPFSKGSY